MTCPDSPANSNTAASNPVTIFIMNPSPNV